MPLVNRSLGGEACIRASAPTCAGPKPPCVWHEGIFSQKIVKPSIEASICTALPPMRAALGESTNLLSRKTGQCGRRDGIGRYCLQTFTDTPVFRSKSLNQGCPFSTSTMPFLHYSSHSERPYISPRSRVIFPVIELPHLGCVDFGWSFIPQCNQVCLQQA